MLRRIASGCALLLTLLVGGACETREQPNRDAVSAGPAPNESALPPRDVAVAKADDLVLLASKNQPEQARNALLEAARLRAALWRLEHKEADLLEALDLYDRVTKAGAKDCAVDLESLWLKSHGNLNTGANNVAALSANSLRALGETAQDNGCKERVSLALAALAAFETPAQAKPVSPGPSPAVPAPAAGASGLASSTLSVPIEPQQTTISGVEHYGAPKSARIVILMSRPSLFEVGELPRKGTQGPRLYVDILGADFVGPAQYEIGGLVERIRLGQHGEGVRAVLDLTGVVTRSVFYLPEPFRLVLDVSAVEEKQPRSKEFRRVVLDPGHGGHDPGAIGAGGLREKDVALDIAHRAAPLIARELGISALLTRDGDAYVPLDERVARANAFGADLFISIHCNASESHAPRGVMTFVLDASGDRVASSIAARENAASEAAATELATAMNQMLDARAVARSTHFATLLQRSAMASLAPHFPDVPSGGVRRAGFYVLAGAEMPAVLFEGSFISNPVEELRLDSPGYRQLLADAIVNAVRAYRDGVGLDK